LKTENFSLSLSLKNSKKPKTWFGTRWSATWGDLAACEIFGFLGKERGDATTTKRPLGQKKVLAETARIT
jgi:hypothetical protein